jgi:hypothetical protein
VDREPETEIVSDARVRLTRKAAKRAYPPSESTVTQEVTNEALSRGADALASKDAATIQRAIQDAFNDAQAEKTLDQRARTPSVVVAGGGEPTVGSLPDEEIRELEVLRIPLNPRLVLASLDEGGPKQVVRVWVGVNRNFRPRMRLRAKRGCGENALWRLIGKRPRLPGRW